ncbi:hypothetical protein DFH27DRAFT_522162 [Peziza echinospora]|nr:hypothetical protein DFH27DRAFT_522162 [Peziza echinospora]
MSVSLCEKTAMLRSIRAGPALPASCMPRPTHRAHYRSGKSVLTTAPDGLGSERQNKGHPRVQRPLPAWRPQGHIVLRQKANDTYGQSYAVIHFLHPALFSGPEAAIMFSESLHFQQILTLTSRSGRTQLRPSTMHQPHCHTPLASAPIWRPAALHASMIYGGREGEGGREARPAASSIRSGRWRAVAEGKAVLQTFVPRLPHSRLGPPRLGPLRCDTTPPGTPTQPIAASLGRRTPPLPVVTPSPRRLAHSPPALASIHTDFALPSRKGLSLPYPADTQPATL